MGDFKRSARRWELRLFRRCYCACKTSDQSELWGMPVPSKALANRSARRHSRDGSKWVVVRFSTRQGMGNVQ